MSTEINSKHNINDRAVRTVEKIEKNIIVRSIRNGMVNMIPILTVGAFSLILMTLPIKAYSEFINVFCGGMLYDLFKFIYSATFRVLSVYMVYTVSLSYLQLNSRDGSVDIGGILASYISFFILCGVFDDGFTLDMIGPKGVFAALLSSLISCWLYLFFRDKTEKRSNIYTAGADVEFHHALARIIPIGISACLFALANKLVIVFSGAPSFNALLHSILNGVFAYGSTGFFKGLMFVILSSVLWFFGLHGGDCLQGVSDQYFVPLLDENINAVAAGATPVHILTKEFFDCFVLMGGCGSCICLLIAIMIFSKDHSKKQLAKTSVFPMLFNVNEIMVFGLPIIFNPVMMIPFLITPTVCYVTAYFAVKTGLVPVVTSSVQWTTPIFLGGYSATGSLTGAILQGVNLCIGVIIYAPFVKLLDNVSVYRNNRYFEAFVDKYKKNESEYENKRICSINGVFGNLTRSLASDFRRDFETDRLNLYYQPQYSYENKCVGVEALLRWNHAEYGMIYPPLIVKIASECNMLEMLEERVLEHALSEHEEIYRKFGDGIKISVNVTGTTIVNPIYLEMLHRMNEIQPFSERNVCLEITEQATIKFTKHTRHVLNDIRNMGILLAIDDFSMGHTSIEYLKDNIFDIIKLDGSLVKGLKDNVRCKEIVYSITSLSSMLSLTVIAEFVEEESEKQILHEIGCNVYQGYLFSPAIPLQDDTEDIDAE